MLYSGDTCMCIDTPHSFYISLSHIYQLLTNYNLIIMLFAFQKFTKGEGGFIYR